MRNILNLEEEKFYITEESTFDKIYDIISLMPNFVLVNKKEELYTDYFYDTEDGFFKKNRATIRLRKYADRQILSVKYISSNINKEEKEREAYLEMPLNFDITKTVKESNAENIKFCEHTIFISKILDDIYSRKLDIDVASKIAQLKVYLVIYTDRESYELKNNRGLNITVHFDRCDYQAKFTKDEDFIVKFVLNSNSLDTLNLEMFNKFIKNVSKQVTLIHDNESKFNAAKIILNYDRFSKKRKFEDYEEEEEEEEEEDDKTSKN